MLRCLHLANLRVHLLLSIFVVMDMFTGQKPQHDQKNKQIWAQIVNNIIQLTSMCEEKHYETVLQLDTDFEALNIKSVVNVSILTR